ncbi:MAG: HD domain-containing protein, partial [Treponema sp.]|nr:HD domain-containing protein [Treponema sp.]
EANMKPFPFLRPRTGIIQYHHENYDGSGYFGLQGGDIPLLSQIIHVADRVEILYSTGHDRFDVARQVVDWKGTWFSPELYEAFAELSAPMSFWLSLDNLFIETELSHRMPIYSMYLTLQELLPIAGIISKIIDEKSPFTGMHSQGIAEKSGIMADFYQFDEDRKIKLVLAAHLHDVGKLVVPNAILDKPGRLTSAEFEVIKVHTFYTRQVLERITGLEDVAEWASNHHEKLDGTGYPYGISKNRLSFESQLLACIDIYQALTEERPYHAPLDRETVRKIMFEMADNNSINRDIVADVLETQC